MIDYWRKMQPRERRLVGVAGLVVVAVLGWTLVWEPIRDARAALVEQIAAQRALVDWLDRLAPEIERLRDRGGTQRTMSGRSTLAVIDQDARAAGLAGALKRIEPGPGDEVRVVLEEAAFPDLMGWLADLVAERPLAVERFSADRTGPGRVDSVVVVGRTDQ